jgi:citrate lyase beta subunit
MLPKAEGGAGVIHADAKLGVREAINGLTDGHIKIVAIATETATALFLAGTYRGASPRLEGLTWGAEDLSAELGAETNRDAEGRFLDPYRLARALCLAGAAAAQVQAIDTVTVTSAISQPCGARRRKRAVTALPARWRSIRRKLPSSTRSSRQRPRPWPGREPSWRLSTPIPARARWESMG